MFILNGYWNLKKNMSGKSNSFNAIFPVEVPSLESVASAAAESARPLFMMFGLPAIMSKFTKYQQLPSAFFVKLSLPTSNRFGAASLTLDKNSSCGDFGALRVLI